MSEYTLEILSQRIEEIKKQYEPRITALKEKGEQIEEDYERPGDVGVVVGVDFKVDWKDVELIFDIPSVRLKQTAISLDLPEISSSRQNISFDVPDVRMVNKKIGQYPETVVKGGFPPRITVRWRDIIVSVPEPYMRRVDISCDVPSVTMKRKDFKLGLPEITMVRQRWVVGLPQFTVVNVSAKTQEIKQKGEDLQKEGESLGQSMKSEIEAEVAKFQASLIATAFSSKIEVTNTYDSALGAVKKSIDDLQAQGCDPIKVPTPQGDINLRKVYQDISDSKNRALVEFSQVVS
jgi:hypothetical protein